MTLEQRVAKLERQNRWLRRGGAVVVAVAAFVFLIAQGGAKELPDLEVRSLTVKGFGPHPRITLGASSDGTATLTFPDRSGKKRIVLSAFGDDGTPALYLADQNGEVRVMITVEANRAMLSLLDASGTIRSHLGADTLWDIVKRTKTKVAEDTLVMYDADGMARALFGLASDGSPSLLVKDKDGNVIWQAPR